MNYIPIDVFRELDLAEVMEAMMRYVDLIDNSYHEKSNNTIMRYWQSKGITLKSILLTDLLDWLCCLAFSDGFIAPEEVQFINTYLNKELSENDITEICKFRINQDYFKHLPLSFILFNEDDLVMKSMGIDIDLDPVEHLYLLFITMGAQFIYCDGNAAFKEISMFNGYAEDLYEKIHDFNLIQKELAVLEISDGKVGGKYSENRYSFNQDIANNYSEKLSELDDLEEIRDEVPQENVSSDIKDSNFETNSFQSKKVNPNNVWDLKVVPNDYYNFTGEFENHLDDFDSILTLKNRDKIKNTYLTTQQYRSILNKIKLTSDTLLVKIINENNIDLNSLSAFEKILLFAESFVKVDYEYSGADLGNYIFNKINLDDRLYTANQIITLIHELSHHLLAEILEQTVMILLNTDKTDAIELYVGFSLMLDKSALMNEYCAHAVESRFTPHGYQDYGSFVKILHDRFDLDKDEEIIEMCKIVGNTFCQDILTIIEPFIDYNLREDIKEQFKKDLVHPPAYQGIFLETKHTLDIYHLLGLIKDILLDGFDEALRNRERLLDYKKQFDFYNKSLE